MKVTRVLFASAHGARARERCAGLCRGRERKEPHRPTRRSRWSWRSSATRSTSRWPRRAGRRHRRGHRQERRPGQGRQLEHARDRSPARSPLPRGLSARHRRGGRVPPEHLRPAARGEPPGAAGRVHEEGADRRVQGELRRRDAQHAHFQRQALRHPHARRFALLWLQRGHLQGARGRRPAEDPGGVLRDRQEVHLQDDPTGRRSTGTSSSRTTTTLE